MLAHDDVGSGPAIVFLHGMGSDHTRWAPIVDRLRDDFRCVAVDLPGHGASPGDGCTTPEAAARVRELVDALGIRAPVVVGHSLGSVVALIYGAAFAPRSVVAVDPVGLYLPNFSDSLAPYADALRGDDFHRAFTEWEAQFPRELLPEAMRATMAAHTTPRREVVLSYWGGVLNREDALARQPAFLAALSAISVPTLVCLADQPNPDDAAVLEQMPSATVEIYAGMGHYLHLVDPQRFAERLRSWIAGLPA